MTYIYGHDDYFPPDDEEDNLRADSDVLPIDLDEVPVRSLEATSPPPPDPNRKVIRSEDPLPAGVFLSTDPQGKQRGEFDDGGAEHEPPPEGWHSRFVGRYTSVTTDHSLISSSSS